jgi:hypothetical protein
MKRHLNHLVKNRATRYSMKRQGVSLNPEDTIPTVEAELLTRRLDISLMSDAACQTKPVKLGARLPNSPINAR